MARAFESLSRSRSWTWGGPLPISVEAVEAWCRMAGIDRAERRLEILDIIQIMDGDWLEDYAAGKLKEPGDASPRRRDHVQGGQEGRR